MVEWGGLENRCAFRGTEGSNPSLSANYCVYVCAYIFVFYFCYAIKGLKKGFKNAVFNNPILKKRNRVYININARGAGWWGYETQPAAYKRLESNVAACTQ